MIEFNTPEIQRVLKVEKGVPLMRSVYRKPVLIDWGSLEDGDSVLVENEKRAMVIVSCFKHFKKVNPDKLIGMRVTWRKVSRQSDERRVYFIK